MSLDVRPRVALCVHSRPLEEIDVQQQITTLHVRSMTSKNISPVSSVNIHTKCY
ncbi:hypothetical protein [Methanogenium organophilum]|uniref:Uncharacterized protein n=1 Tax=Methanogenium organophilum TaxID=2199 RepID=A0A9X9S4W3_METOG|nr:hypothetical protein [Methanogenium organophilum]WAI01999.1 hypothetical protein OU421_03770 [Methanogenium organophilum]